VIFKAAASANSLDALSQRSKLVKPPQSAVVIPVGCGEGMDPGGVGWSAFLKPARGKVDVYSLSVPWGILPESTWMSWPGFLEVENDITERQAIRDAVDRVRAWMNSRGTTYRQILMVPSGSNVDVWSQGVRGCASAERVKLLRVPKGRESFGHPSVRRALCGALGL
jgi:hypothetical protein